MAEAITFVGTDGLSFNDIYATLHPYLGRRCIIKVGEVACVAFPTMIKHPGIFILYTRIDSNDSCGLAQINLTDETSVYIELIKDNRGI